MNLLLSLDLSCKRDNVSKTSPGWIKVKQIENKGFLFGVIQLAYLACAIQRGFFKYWLAEGHETLLYNIPLSLGKGSATRQAINCVEHGVDHDGPVVCSSKQWSTLCKKRQYSRTEVAVQSQGHFSCAECRLKSEKTKNCLDSLHYLKDRQIH